MVDVIQIPNLPAATSLDGTEQLEIVQGGVSSRTTAYDIASLAGSSGANGVQTKNQFVAALVNDGIAYLASGADIVIDEALSFQSASAEIYGDENSTISFTSVGSLTFANYPVVLEGVNFVGPLTSETQWAEAITGSTISTAFDTPTYSDGSSTISGADFTHTKVGSVLTISMDATFAFSTATRLVVSDFIALDPTKRYVTTAAKGASAGQGNAAPIYYLYNGAQALIGTYNPSNSSSWYSAITGASYMKIAVGMFRFVHTATGLSCSFDFSKFGVVAAYNELATVSLAFANENATRILISNSTSPVVRGCTFKFMDSACLKFVTGSNMLVENNHVSFSFGGITHQTCSGARYLKNVWDMRFRTTGGAMLGQRMLRNHCISASGVDDTTIAFNTMRGASWAVENIMNNNAYYGIVDNNEIRAEYVGISLGHGGSTAPVPNRVSNNTICLSSDGYIGIECPAGSNGFRAIVDNNTITVDDYLIGTVGVAVSGDSQDIRVDVTGGYISCPLMVTCLGATQTGYLRVENVVGEFAQNGVFSRSYQTFVRNCRFTLARNMLVFGTEMQACVRIEPPTNSVDQYVENSEIAKTATYTGYSTATNLYIVGNRHPYGGVTYANRVGEYRFLIIALASNIATRFFFQNNSFELSSVNTWTTTSGSPSFYSGTVISIVGNTYAGNQVNQAPTMNITVPNYNVNAGTPEGFIQAVIGSTYSRIDGGAATSFYVKESGTGNTGWVGK